MRLTESVYLQGGTYNFTANSDNGVIVWMDSDQVIYNWSGSPSFSANGSTHTVVAPGQHLITIAYRHPGGPGQLNVNWWPQQ